MGRDPLDELAANQGDKKNDMDHMAVGQCPLARDRCTMGTLQEKMPPVRVHTWNHSA